jgi:CheY-like chemotaxis protein
MPKILYIDDEALSEAKRYQDRLSRAEGLQCELVPPLKWEDVGDLSTDTPDLFLVDYELSLLQPNGTKAPYTGTTLTAEIRARFPDHPIVLITRELILGRLNPQTRRQLTEHIQICDELIFKSYLDNKLDETQELLISLASGFDVLRKIQDKNWPQLVEVLRAEDEEADLLREAAPPLERNQLKKGEWIVTGVANWIRNVVLRFPGILYDPVNAATRLGISTESFLNERAQSLFDPAGYKGIFAPHEGCWWKGRLFRIAKELTTDGNVSGPTNRAFPEAFDKRFGIQLSPAVCIWDHKPVADWVCYIMRQPVKIENSLRYYPDSRPSIMDHARISFRAIRESNDFEEELLDSEGGRLLKKIEELPEP